MSSSVTGPRLSCCGSVATGASTAGRDGGGHHLRREDKDVKVIIDLTPTRGMTGPARLMDMIAGRSKASSKTCLEARPEAWRKDISVVATDGFIRFKIETHDALSHAITVMDPFHVVRLAGDALDECRRRVQHQLHKRRGRKVGPLHKTRRTLHTLTSLLTDRQRDRLSALYVSEQHITVEATWEVYQAMVEAYWEPDRA